MRILILIALMLSICTACAIAFATATSETGDSRAVPEVAYGTTSGGDIKPILVAADGTLQIA